MTTVSPYEPALKYEPLFDRKEKTNKQKVYVTQANGNDASRYFGTFEGNTVEELLYTILNFESLASDLSMDNDDKITQFQMQLGTAPRAVWNDLVINRHGGPFAPDEWEEAKEEFIQRHSPSSIHNRRFHQANQN
jgi:hypothetical protein